MLNGQPAHPVASNFSGRLSTTQLSPDHLDATPPLYTICVQSSLVISHQAVASQPIKAVRFGYFVASSGANSAAIMLGLYYQDNRKSAAGFAGRIFGAYSSEGKSSTLSGLRTNPRYFISAIGAPTCV